MSLEVLEEHINPVLRRREVKLTIRHQGTGTPDRLTVRKLASEHFNASFDRVFVRSISTRTGGSSALCAVEVYDDAKVAERTVPDYLKNRNLPKEQRISKKKGEESKPAPKAPAPTATVAKPSAEKKTAEMKPTVEKKTVEPKPAPEKKAESGKESKPAQAKAPAKPEPKPRA